MADSQPTYVACDGGLVLDTSKFNLFHRPGVATVLNNYEIDIGGGYRRVNGYYKLGSASATKVTGSTTPILGTHVYGLGVVAVASTGVYYTEDGITYIQVNKNTGASGMTQAALAGATTLTRSSQVRGRFVLVLGEETNATNPYGTLYIATGADKLARFYITGTGAGRTFTYTELATPAAATLIADCDGHLCVVDSINAPNTVYYSAYNRYFDFSGASAGSETVSQYIEGIATFRKQLFIFGKKEIRRLVDINSPAAIATETITTNLGCIAGDSIQEIGGDLIFLSQDGFRTVAGTARIGDVELSSISKEIQPLISRVVSGLSVYTISSTVLKKKSQYRFFYTNTSGIGKGITMTIRNDQYGNIVYQWSELTGYPVNSINSHYDSSGTEIIYHGGLDGYIYVHDSGNSFDGANIPTAYRSPDMHLGDLGSRKTLHYLDLSIVNSTSFQVYLTPRFDFNSTLVQQPSAISISVTGSSAVYGVGLYGSCFYGPTITPLTRVPLQGSCHSVSFEITSNDMNAPYTIQGYHIEEFPSGRK